MSKAKNLKVTDLQKGLLLCGQNPLISSFLGSMLGILIIFLTISGTIGNCYLYRSNVVEHRNFIQFNPTVNLPIFIPAF